MRKVSTLVGITLSALAATASAKEATHAPAPAAAPAAEPAATAPAPAAEPAPAPATEAAPAPADTAATAAAPASAPHRRFEVGLAFLPMALGRFTFSPGGKPKTVDAAFAYGGALSVSYEVLPGLLVGLVPQITFNVKDKNDAQAAKQIDIFARIAYAYRPIESVTLYAELLPGYSDIVPPAGLDAKGFVLVVGGGTAINFTDRYFANIGVGYQKGFQNRKEGPLTLETRTTYIRATLGGGVRF